MIKILMCGNDPSNKGGMTTVISQIEEYDWGKNGIKMDFIPTFKPGNAIKKSAFFCFSFIKILCKFLLDKPDVVYMHMSYRGSFIRKFLINSLSKFFGTKTIIHLHGSEFKEWYYLCNSKKQKKICYLLRNCDKFIVLGENWKDFILSIEPNAPVTVQNNCIKVTSKKVFWNDSHCEVLFMGALIKRKGVADLLNAVKLLKDSNTMNNMHFTIAGEGPEENELKTLTENLGISENVSFVGWINGGEKNRYYENCQIFILPSYNEGLPVSVLEAASYGMPIIATDVGDISCVVHNNINGILLQPGNAEAIKNALIKINNCDKFQAMSKNSAKIIMENFSIDIFYKNLLGIFFEVANK